MKKYLRLLKCEIRREDLYFYKFWECQPKIVSRTPTAEKSTSTNTLLSPKLYSFFNLGKYEPTKHCAITRLMAAHGSYPRLLPPLHLQD
jgi:hypothetical protein